MRPPNLRFLYFIGSLFIIVSLSCTTLNNLTGVTDETFPTSTIVIPGGELPSAETPTPEIPSPTPGEEVTAPDETAPPATTVH